MLHVALKVGTNFTMKHVGLRVLNLGTGFTTQNNGRHTKNRICSFNMHGFNNSESYLHNLCSSNDMIFVQEHWLVSSQLQKLIIFIVISDFMVAPPSTKFVAKACYVVDRMVA